jgi:glycosyltransferase involved in cell wall biosynthesis
VLISEFVDTQTFSPPASSDSDRPVRVFMGARLLWDKGVQEFVDTARIVRERVDVRVEFWLAGEPDTGAPNHVPRAQLKEWDEEGVINWLGHRSDMPELFRQVDIGFLPTHYNEGTPRFLVEGASSGLPLVTTDTEACRRVVHDGKNGYVAPKKAPKAFAEAVTELVVDAEQRRTFGSKSRHLAENMYEKEQNLDAWMRLYHQLLSHRG